MRNPIKYFIGVEAVQNGTPVYLPFSYHWRVLWVNTYAPNLYRPPNNNPDALYGFFNNRPLTARDFGDSSAEVYTPNLNYKGPEFNSHAARARMFFGYPFPDAKGNLGAWNVTKFGFKLLPKTLLNSAKLITEIGTGLLEYGLKRAVARVATFIALEQNPALLAGAYALSLLVLKPLSLVAVLLRFTGNAITSPQRNAREAWNYFASLRQSNNILAKIAGYGLGAAGWMFSMALTVSSWLLIASLVAPLVALVGTAIGISQVPSILLPVVKFLSPVTEFLGQVVGSAISSGLSFLVAKIPTVGFTSVILPGLNLIATSSLALGVSGAIATVYAAGKALAYAAPSIKNVIGKVGTFLKAGIMYLVDQIKGDNIKIESLHVKTEKKPSPPIIPSDVGILKQLQTLPGKAKASLTETIADFRASASTGFGFKAKQPRNNPTHSDGKTNTLTRRRET